ncbi:Fibrillarin, partial [mine drainage metagenome]
MDPTNWPGVFREGRDLYTVNLRPGERVYGEELRVSARVEYRQWDPFRSKLAAWLLRGAEEAPWVGAKNVLYLGAAHGTTASHLSDLLPDARIFVVEKSPTSFAPLLALARRRTNLYPILADAQPSRA